jgi:hypothetical protein
MKAFIKNRACLVFLLFISITASAYTGDDLKPVKIKREIKQQCRKQKGACSSYRVKDFTKPDKFKTSRKRTSRSYR